MKQIRTGLVGCGKVGDFHARAFAGLAESQFVAVCDADLGRAVAFADRYGVKAYDSVEKMIGDSGVEALSVCTPHPLHAAAAVPAARAGCHVLVEKPLAISLEDADRILEAAQAGGATVGTMSQRRLYRPCQRIRQAIDDGRIGRPVLAVATILGWRDQAYYESDPWRGTWKGEGGGVLVNQAPHHLDLLQWYMGPIDEVYGRWENLNHPYIEVEDTAVAVVSFKSGGLGSIVVSNSQNPALFGGIRLHGDNGASVGVQTDGGNMFVAGMSSIAEAPFNDVWTVPGEADKLDEWKRADTEFFHSVDSTHHYHFEQIRDFLEAVATGRKPMVDGLEGRKTVELFTAVYQSSRDRKPVKFPL